MSEAFESRYTGYMGRAGDESQRRLSFLRDTAEPTSSTGFFPSKWERLGKRLTVEPSFQRKETPLGLAKVCFYSVILFTVPGIRTPQRGIQNPRLSLHGETPDYGALFRGSFLT